MKDSKSILPNGKKAAVLFSGGKDSCLALHIAKKQGYDIKYLLSIIPENFDSFMFHKPYLNLLERQAEMLDMDLIVFGSKGKENEELEDLKELIKSIRDKVKVIIVGGIASNYQGKRVKKVCDELKLGFYAPLWDYNGEKIWEELLMKNFRVIITKISCEGIPVNFLGKIIDEKIFLELRKLSEKYKFRLDFEGGEAESAVLYMPEFKKGIHIKFNVKSEGKYRHFLEITDVYN